MEKEKKEIEGMELFYTSTLNALVRDVTRKGYIIRDNRTDPAGGLSFEVVRPLETRSASVCCATWPWLYWRIADAANKEGLTVSELVNNILFREFVTSDEFVPPGKDFIKKYDAFMTRYVNNTVQEVAEQAEEKGARVWAGWRGGSPVLDSFKVVYEQKEERRTRGASLFMKPSQWAVLKEKADAAGISFNELANRIFDDYVNRDAAAE